MYMPKNEKLFSFLKVYQIRLNGREWIFMKLIITETDIIYVLVLIGYILYVAYRQKDSSASHSLLYRCSQKGNGIFCFVYAILIIVFLILVHGVPFYPSYDIVSLKYWLFLLMLCILEIKEEKLKEVFNNNYPLKYLFKGLFFQRILSWLSLGCIVVLMILFLGLK